jgi:hypothetical protein
MNLGAIGLGRGTTRYINSKYVVDFFSGYGDSFQAFVYFCLGKFIWRAPNADLIRFEYDPVTGEKINWLEIYELNKEEFKDFSEELDDMFYNNLKEIN